MQLFLGTGSSLWMIIKMFIITIWYNNLANWAHALSCKAILTSIKGENVFSGNQDTILYLKIKTS